MSLVQQYCGAPTNSPPHRPGGPSFGDALVWHCPPRFKKHAESITIYLQCLNPAVPKLGVAAPWCVATLCQGRHESCCICRWSSHTWCLVSSLLCIAKFCNGKIVPGGFTCERISLHSYTSQCVACPYVVCCVTMGRCLMNTIKHCYNCNKIDIERQMRVAVSNIEPRFDEMCTEQQAHTSH